MNIYGSTSDEIADYALGAIDPEHHQALRKHFEQGCVTEAYPGNSDSLEPVVIVTVQRPDKGLITRQYQPT